ncbi:MAG TPA: hypothetical protein PKY51_02860 [Fimbriimonadaceae bacterium]|nr:hypothetical protein [Fimbriimonadaceae bacterium]
MEVDSDYVLTVTFQAADHLAPLHVPHDGGVVRGSGHESHPLMLWIVDIGHVSVTSQHNPFRFDLERVTISRAVFRRSKRVWDTFQLCTKERGIAKAPEFEVGIKNQAPR